MAALVAALASFGAAATPASAGPLVTTARDCAANTLTQPFAGFGDNAWYTDVPGGSFEPAAAAWSLTGGAKTVAGNEPWQVRSKTDWRSLYLPAGATATSPAMCVGLSEPTLRYFSKSSLTGAMSVEVLTETSLGEVVAVPLAPAALTLGWSPGPGPTPIVANLLPLLPDSKTAVAFRFRATSGNWNLDDVYVDPYRSR